MLPSFPENAISLVPFSLSFSYKLDLTKKGSRMNRFIYTPLSTKRKITLQDIRREEAEVAEVAEESRGKIVHLRF